MNTLFINGTASIQEQTLFEKLASWMGSATVIRGGQRAPFQPDVVVNLHTVWTPREYQAMGITENPVQVCYLLGQTPTGGGESIWSQKFPMFTDHFFAYGDMVQAQDGISIGFLPLPFDINSVPAANPDESELRCAHLIARFWKKSDKALAGLKQSGVQVDVINGETKGRAMARLRTAHIHVGNFNYGNLGKSDLEAMTAGLCCLGWLKPTVRAMYETLGSNFPFMDCTQDTIACVIGRLTITQAKLQGAAARDWMLGNYTPAKLAAAWKNKLASLLS